MKYYSFRFSINRTLDDFKSYTYVINFVWYILNWLDKVLEKEISNQFYLFVQDKPLYDKINKKYDYYIFIITEYSFILDILRNKIKNNGYPLVYPILKGYEQISTKKRHISEIYCSSQLTTEPIKQKVYKGIKHICHGNEFISRNKLPSVPDSLLGAYRDQILMAFVNIKLIDIDKLIWVRDDWVEHKRNTIKYYKL